ncbi:PapD-like protein, partial [Tribonema minus]
MAWEPMQIEPPEVLEFQISGEDEPQQCPLVFTNTNPIAAVAFKVKTTKPKRYLVRPNQGLVMPGGSETSTITLLAAEARVIFEEHAQTGVWDDSNKFLVQTVAVDGDFFNTFNQSGPKEQTNMLTDLWSNISKQKAVKQKKLRVAF